MPSGSCARDRAHGFTATVADGATRGAMFAWDVAPGRAGHGVGNRSVAVLSLYPRLETSGYVPRKFIAAEPLLEHGMSLALGYADAMSMARALHQVTVMPALMKLSFWCSAW